MFHEIEPFCYDRLLISVEAEIDTTHVSIDSMRVYKIGEVFNPTTRQLDPTRVEITDGLTHNEALALMKMTIDDYLETEQKNREPDGLAMSKTRKEWDQEDAS